MRLIDADALDLEREVEMADDWNTAHEIANIVKYAPAIPAVPLEPLCEWLATWFEQDVPCFMCREVLGLESCPHGPFDCGDKDHWKMLINKWMEGQHEQE